VRFPHGPRDIGYGEETEPDFSPDGLWLVLKRDAGHKPTLYAASGGGGGARLSPDYPAEEAAGAWSPDGRRIAFRLRVRDRCFLAVRSSVGGGTDRLAHVIGPSGCADRPAWSPDGRRIAYASANDLWTIPSGGGRPLRVTYSPAVAEFGPRWDPSGTGLTYRDASGIWLLPPAGTPRLLAAGGGAFAWSHRGGSLAYVTAGGALVVRSRAGAETALVTGSGSPDTGDLITDPSWSPDDGRIAFTLPPDPADRYGSPSVAVVDIATRRLRLVAGSGDQWGSWAPDWRG
jgi:Tol biopolymer transport system component